MNTNGIDIRDVLKLIMLIALFIFQVKLGVNEIPIFSYALTMAISTFLFIRNCSVNKNIFIFGLIFSMIVLINGMKSISNVFLAIKFLLMLSPAIFIVHVMPLEEFSGKILLAVKLVTIISILFYFIGIGVDTSYSFNRMQGFASEPSALALPVAILMLHSLINRSWGYFFLASLVGGLALSPTVLLVSLLSLIVYKFIYSSSMTKVFISLLAVSILFFGLDIVGFLAEHFSDIAIIRRINDGLLFAFSGGESGYNTRLSYGYFFEEYQSTFGLGVNTYSGDRLRDWNIHLETIYAFGMFGWFLFIAFSLFVCRYLKSMHNFSLNIFLCAYIYSSINSAQGIVFTIIVWTYFMYFLKSIKLRRLIYA
jgi:hypothetical protein